MNLFVRHQPLLHPARVVIPRDDIVIRNAEGGRQGKAERPHLDMLPAMAHEPLAESCGVLGKTDVWLELWHHALIFANAAVLPNSIIRQLNE